MLQGTLWGRPRWTWALDVAVVVLFSFVLISATEPTIRLLALAAIALRVVTSLVPVAVWYVRSRRSTVSPPRRR